MHTVEHPAIRSEHATPADRIAAALDDITRDLEQATRMADGVDKYERLSVLFRREAKCWKSYHATLTRRLSWRSAAAAADRAFRLAQYWEARAIAELQDSGQLWPLGRVA